MANQKLVSSFTSPLLILPLEDGQVCEGHSNNKLGMFNLKDKTIVYLNINFERSQDIFVSEDEDDRIIGFSHGWLMVLHKNSGLTLVNALSRMPIKLPRVQLESTSCTSSQRVSINKAILNVDPSSRDNNYMAVIIYGYDEKLAFYRCGNKTWTTFSRSKGYNDLAWFNNLLYTLRDGIIIEGWDFDSFSPTRKIRVQCSYTSTMSFPRDRVSTQWYLVPLLGEILFIIRYIGEFVNEEGERLCEGDTLGGEDNQPLVFPYRTFHFQVYEVDMIGKKVNEVQSLKDQVIFLGGNHSFSVSAKDHQELKGNSIYFTDDYWDQMFVDYSYGGHDFGSFSLEDKTISPLYECKFKQRFYPPPIWIMPNNGNSQVLNSDRRSDFLAILEHDVIEPFCFSIN